MRYRYAVVAIVSPLIVVLDQLTKFLIVSFIPLGGEVTVISGYVDLVHTRNVGAAFGMMADLSPSFRLPFFYIVAAGAVVVMAFMLWRAREDERLLPLTFALIVAGIAGNIIDRIRLDGAVVDFLSVHWHDTVLSGDVWKWHIEIPLSWPAFNVADSAITIAMVLLIAAALRRPKTLADS